MVVFIGKKVVLSMQREKYKAAVEVLEQYRSNREGIRALKVKMQRLSLRTGPKELTATAYDNVGGSVYPYHKSVLEIANEIEEIKMNIADKIAMMEIVEDALMIVGMGKQAEYFADILIMRHVDGWSMCEIADKLGYASRQTIYNQYNRAMAKFANAIGL